MQCQQYRLNVPGAASPGLNWPCVLLGIVLAAVGPHPALAADTKLYDIEYTILSAALNHGLGAEPSDVIIDGRTTGIVINLAPPDVTRETLAAELGTTGLALDEWSRTNRGRYTLQTGFTLRSTYTLLDQSRRDALFNDADPARNWAQFRAAHPRSSGIVRLSRPGIDDAANTALVYLEFQCGEACGSGRLINLTRDPAGAWHVASGSLVWITSPEESP